MTISVGKMAGNAIVPYSQATRRTKELDISSYITMQDGRTINSVDVKAVFRADSNDNWEVYIQGNIHTNSASTTAEFTVAGIAVRDLDQAGMLLWQCGTARAYAVSGGAIIAFVNSYATKPSYLSVGGISSDAEFAFEATVPLASEPTWASLGTTASDALEAVTDASIYIEPASATQAGIVGGGNQVPGDTSGTAIAAGYIGEVLSTSQATITNATYTSRGIDTYAQDLSLSITSGSWEIILRGVSGPSGAGISMIAAKILIDGSPISDKEGLDKAIITTPWVNPSNGNHATLVMYHEATGNETITVETAKLTGSTTIQKSYWQLTAKRIG